MLYRPRFCCECGEKIVREEWRLLNSRRFCELCETEFKGVDYVPRAVVVAGLVLAVFGFKGMFTGPAVLPDTRSPAAAHAVEQRALKPSTFCTEPAPVVSPSPPMPVPSDKLEEQPAKQGISSEPRSYFCGAITKKGTPCSRRVKEKGVRCWQHADRAE